MESIKPSSDYLEARFLGRCKPQYSCVASYAIFRAARIFDPSYLSEHAASIDNAFIDSLTVIKPLTRDDGALVVALKRDLHLFKAAACGFTVDHL